MSLLISIDFDSTFTADPELWSIFIQTAKLAGHKVICITARRDILDNRIELEEAFKGLIYPDNIHFAYDCPKKQYATEKGLWVDIWIDDCPEAIV